MSAIESAISILRQEEGYRESVYYCSENYPTIGIGKRIGPKSAPLNQYQFTVSHTLAEQWLREDVNSIYDKLLEFAPYCHQLSDCRVAILISMAYQMGMQGLLGFKNALRAIEAGNFYDAANEMRDSRWWKTQTRVRAERHAQAMAVDVYVYA